MINNFTADDVKKLRELTGAGMMDCKRVLSKFDGDFNKALEFIQSDKFVSFVTLLGKGVK